ncbi:MAG TPA: porin [Acidiferrobacterales bacterium]
MHISHVLRRARVRGDRRAIRVVSTLSVHPVALAVAATLAVGLPSVAGAADDLATVKSDVEQLKRDVAQANEWRTVNSNVHLTGYAAVSYSAPEAGDSSFGGTTFNPIFHYLYKDLLLLEAELEIELEDDGATATALEYLTLDLFVNDYLTVIAGKFLSPIGQFRQNLHPAWINKLPSAPLGFGHEGAAPLSDVGLQLRGGVPLGPAKVNYAVYTGNGPKLELNGVGTEIEAVMSEGFGADNNENKVVGARIGVLPVPNLEIGASAATGSTLDDTGATGKRDYDVIGADAALQIAGLDLRAEYVRSEIGAGPVAAVDPGEKQWKTWYGQAAYRIPGTPLEAVARFGKFTPPGANPTEQWAVGVNYVFAANVIAKLAYEANDTEGVEDDDRALAQIAYGF